MSRIVDRFFAPLGSLLAAVTRPQRSLPAPDRVSSGASTLRSAYQALLEGARRGEFDIVVAEALDRLSRDQEDVAGLLKRLRFAGVRPSWPSSEDPARKLMSRSDSHVSPSRAENRLAREECR